MIELLPLFFLNKKEKRKRTDGGLFKKRERAKRPGSVETKISNLRGNKINNN
jgi:hypothetical protein